MNTREFLNAFYGPNPPKFKPQILAALHLNPPLVTKTREAKFLRLPDRHRQLLGLSDGMDLLAGSYRLFSWTYAPARTMQMWNENATWKFAWGGTANPWFCFGESVLGNQFAYREDELAPGADPKVYELYAVTMQPLCDYRNFDHFFDGGFLNGVRNDSYHQRITAARKQIGSFDLAQHLAYMPSPLLAGGKVDVQQLMPMQAEAHLTVNGDLWRELAHRDSLAGLRGLENYVDDKGRMRLRAVWGPPMKQ